MFLCNSCWNESIKRQGQCPSCKEWNSLKEFKESSIWWEKSKKARWTVKELKNIKEIDKKNTLEKIITKSNEFNNVLVIVSVEHCLFYWAHLT